jgi:hypothetical protein
MKILGPIGPFCSFFFCEKENEPKEIVPRDVALTGFLKATRYAGGESHHLSIPKLL